jgi:hypothetical protein
MAQKKGAIELPAVASDKLAVEKAVVFIVLLRLLLDLDDE